MDGDIQAEIVKMVSELEPQRKEVLRLATNLLMTFGLPETGESHLKVQRIILLDDFNRYILIDL